MKRLRIFSGKHRPATSKRQHREWVTFREADYSTEIGRLCVQGRTVREIAAQLGYSRSLVHKTFANSGSLRVAKATD